MANLITKALGTDTNKYVQVVNLLFNTRTNAHIAHLQTRSFSAHKALNEFYDGVLDIADSFAEASQGTQGILTGYDLGKLWSGDPIPNIRAQYQELVNLKS